VIASPEAFAKIIATDIAKYSKIAKQAGITAH